MISSARQMLPPLLSVLLLLTACVEGTTRPDDCADASVTRAATLSGEQLDPSQVEVCRGQEVTITFDIQRNAILHLHGFDDQVPAQEVRAGETVTFEFTANQAGQFPIEIHTDDGPAEATAGTLIVHEP